MSVAAAFAARRSIVEGRALFGDSLAVGAAGNALPSPGRLLVRKPFVFSDGVAVGVCAFHVSGLFFYTAADSPRD